jgi:hypothetical protein
MQQRLVRHGHLPERESLEALIPVLYLKGISTGDFEEALAALRLTSLVTNI